MPRHCGPCEDNGRIELDRRLLNMELSGESFRTISLDTGYSESALKRHKSNHLGQDVSDVIGAMRAAREAALEEARQKELETIKEEVVAEAKEGLAARLELCRDHFDQLRILRERAALALETAETAEDVKTALLAIKELRELVRLWGELEGKLQSQPTVNVLVNPEWIELRTVIIQALDPYPQAKQEVVNAIRGR